MPDFVYEKPDNLVELWETSATLHAARPLFGTRLDDGSFRWVTYGEVARRVDDTRAGLASLGIGPGAAVGIIANNRTEWAVAAFASYGLGARFVPMYEAELPAVWRYIVADAGIEVLFVANPGVLAALGELASIPSLRHVVVIDAAGEGSLAALEQGGRNAPVPSRRPAATDVATLIYTSGTTGEPKGVLLTHGNFTSNARAGHRLYSFLTQEDRSLCMLPWAHVYGQTAELYHFISFGGSMALAGGPTTLAQDFVVARPTYIITVPRVFNRIYAGVWAAMREAGGLKLRLFSAALAAAAQRRASGRTSLRLRVLDRLVFSKIRARFGGRLKGALSGSAKMSVDIAQFFFDIGIPVFDCYGLTETSPAVTMNHQAAHKLGTVGRPIEGVSVSIDRTRVDDGSGEGEVIVHGPNVMVGYHNKPEATAAVMTADGGFRTGDRGRLDEDGYLCITGRFKEQYKLENGKYVFPAAIEEEIRRIPYVLNAMVVGAGRPFNTCLIVADLELLRRSARELGLAMEASLTLASDTPEGAKVRDLLGKDISRQLVGKFASYEIPRCYHFIDEDFTVANGMLTQTLKLKRRAVRERYGALLEGSAAPQPVTPAATP